MVTIDASEDKSEPEVFQDKQSEMIPWDIYVLVALVVLISLVYALRPYLFLH